MSNASSPPYISRIVTGTCTWEDHVEVDVLLKELLRQDGFAYAQLEGLRRDAQDVGGLAAAYGRKSPTDYRAPLPFTPKGVTDPPWLGELKFSGKPRPRRQGTSLEWRLYFGEPIEATGLVFACGLGSKDPMQTEGLTKAQQKRQVIQSMGRFKNYCKGKGYTYEPFPV